MKAFLRDLGLFCLRLTTGWILVIHGWDKVRDLSGITGMLEGANFPVPEVFGIAAACAEFAGGILLILGLLTPLAALLAACTMGVAAIWWHLMLQWAPAEASSGLWGSVDGFLKTVHNTQWEFPLALFGATLCLLFAGPGRWSLDGWILRRARRKREAPPAAPPAPEPEASSLGRDDTPLEDLLPSGGSETPGEPDDDL